LVIGYFMSLAILVFFAIWTLVIKKNCLSLISIIAFLNMNFLLYLLRLSDNIQFEVDGSTYLIMVYLNIATCMASLIFGQPLKSVKNSQNLRDINISFSHSKMVILFLMNFIYLGLVLVENYLGSNTFFPYLSGIDIHVYSASLISYFTHNTGVVVMLNYVAIKKGNLRKSSKKWLFLFIFLDIFWFFITKGARMGPFVWTIEFFIFFICYENFHIKFITKFKVIVIAIIIAITFVGAGNIRVSNNGEYDLSYSTGIQYTGYEDPLGLLPWYYGYFPMSFEVLNESIINAKYQNFNQTNGIYTFRPILEGVFQLQNIVKDYPNYTADLYRLYPNGLTTVPTGFYEFFIDYGDLNFISLTIYIFFTYFIYKRINLNIKYTMIYAVLLTGWVLMSFQNILCTATAFYSIVFILIGNKILFSTKAK